MYYILRIVDGTFQSVGWATNIAVLSNWFPRKGRGLIIGVWACSQNMGDIFGVQIYKAFARRDSNHWGTAFFFIAAFILLLGVLNLYFLHEYPSEIGITVEEDTSIFKVQL